MTDMNNAMKADYLRVLSENKKMKQQIANLEKEMAHLKGMIPKDCLLYTSPSPRDYAASRMPSSA